MSQKDGTASTHVSGQEISGQWLTCHLSHPPVFQSVENLNMTEEDLK